MRLPIVAACGLSAVTICNSQQAVQAAVPAVAAPTKVGNGVNDWVVPTESTEIAASVSISQPETIAQPETRTTTPLPPLQAPIAAAVETPVRAPAAVASTVASTPVSTTVKATAQPTATPLAKPAQPIAPPKIAAIAQPVVVPVAQSKVVAPPVAQPKVVAQSKMPAAVSPVVKQPVVKPATPKITKPTQPTSISPDLAVTILDVKITGVDAEIQGILRDRLTTQAGNQSSVNQVQQDITKLLESGLIDRANFTTQLTQDGMVVNFQVAPRSCVGLN
jgi:hypothetical protein